ncbi:hypothetical protein [Nesterenkonia rhizosphaerae]|uniref:Glycosyl transferase family 28 C-terminal domain-containing protein n=1 Tax=Nesterenkonia rhizosphaerae TaxID=1348272 RepID=A0ABP9FXJ5_9MICC
MIGCYIHNQGAGHLHRSLTWARAWSQLNQEPVAGLSSLEQPRDWPGPWVSLEADDDGSTSHHSAGGVLHWAPVHHAGLRSRMTRISQWISSENPDLLVADVSVEVAMLARLHGVPVVTVALPGDRTDRTHALGYEISSAIAGFWPPAATGIIGRQDQGAAVSPLGAISRFTPAAADNPDSTRAPRSPEAPGILIMGGRGGGGIPPAAQRAVTAAFPQARITHIGGTTGTWTSDPWSALQQADVVVTAAGQNSLAEVAASRTPAVVYALDRPHQEQRHTLESLRRGPWPVIPAPESADAVAWRHVLEAALQLNGNDWRTWCDGQAQHRFAALLEQVRDSMKPHPVQSHPAQSHPAQSPPSIPTVQASPGPSPRTNQ